ncbi:MAG: glycosyltransferase [Lachnospiraceae bacterium]|nr:glycosyltransferase [Lachnospiraceae bacterium]
MNRILLIGLTPFASGINTFIKNTYPYMDHDLFRYDFLMMEKYRDRPLPAQFDTAGSSFHYLDFTRDGIPEASREKLRDILASIPDLCGVHVHDMHQMTYPLALADRMGLPVKVIQFHTGRPKHQKERPAEPEVMERLELIRGDRFDRLACSDLAGEEGFRGMPFEVVPNGIDPDRFAFRPLYRELIRRRLRISEETSVLGFFANIHEVKNPIFALRVFRELLKFSPESVLLFAGLNHTDPKLRGAIREYGLEARVRFVQTDDSIDMLYSAADLLLFPSLREGFPFVLLEAQASGLPCLISDEVTDQVRITDLAHMLPLEKGPEIWAKKALQILQGKTNRMSRGKEIAAAGFHVADAAKKIQNLYLYRIRGDGSANRATPGKNGSCYTDMQS